MSEREGERYKEREREREIVPRVLAKFTACLWSLISTRAQMMLRGFELA